MNHSKNTAAGVAQTQDELDLLKKTAHLANQRSLIVNLLSMEETKNDSLDAFDKLVREDFWELSKALGQSTARQDYLTLSAITQELQMIVGSPDVHMKSIIGICGGFSSGKSALINSFIESSSVRLTEGVNPVTAVASYVTHRSTLKMQAYSKNGNSCELTQEHYQQLDHEAQKDSPIDLQRLLSYVTIGLPMTHKDIFADLCLIDTPGYNPANFGTKTADNKTAHKFAKQSDALIWVVSAEQGTLPQSDLDFINDIKNNGFLGKLYIVINKADLKSESDRKIILEEVIDKVDFEFLDYEGISLYSSSHRKELGYHKQSLLDFLATCASPESNSQSSCDVTLDESASLFAPSSECKSSKSVFNGIHSKINTIFDGYQDFIKQDESWVTELKRQFKSLTLDIIQSGGTEAWDMAEPRINGILDLVDGKLALKHTELTRQVEDLRTALLTCTYQIEKDLKAQRET